MTDVIGRGEAYGEIIRDIALPKLFLLEQRLGEV
jgi:hypothetical protein